MATRVPAFDGLRGIAILMVLVFHTPLRARAPGGFVGVDVFFALSGFLITALLLDEWRRTGDVRIGEFFARRVRRLAPALVCFLAAIWLMAWLMPVSPAVSRLPIDLWRLIDPTVQSLTYVSNWEIAFDRRNWPGAMIHLWSLSLEGQFYLLWAIVLVFLLRRRIAMKHILVAVLVFTAAASVWRGVVWLDAKSYARPFFSSDTRIAGLFAGVAVAIALTLVRPGQRRWLGIAAWPCFGLLVVAMFVLHNKRAPTYLGGLTVVHIVSAALIAAVVLAPRSWATRALGVLPLAWLGRLSYSVYLWHWPACLIVFGTMHAPLVVELMVAMAISVAVGAASYYGVERPFLRGPSVRLAAAAVPAVRVIHRAALPRRNRPTPRTPSAPIPVV